MSFRVPDDTEPESDNYSTASDDNMAPQPTLEDLVNEIKALCKTVETQQKTIEDQEICLAKRGKEPGEIIKPKLPEPFDGDPRKIQKYFAEAQIYFSYYPRSMAKPHNRVRLAGGCLTGAAEIWFRPMMDDFVKNSDWDDIKWDDMKKETKQIFESYGVYEEQITKFFGATNEEREAERELRFIKQKGPLYKHTTTFN